MHKALGILIKALNEVRPFSVAFTVFTGREKASAIDVVSISFANVQILLTLISSVLLSGPFALRHWRSA